MPRWLGALSAFRHPRVIAMLFLGFSAGIPILLIFSSLSLWLREAGVERSAVTFFSWAALGYSFKFVWAPLVDKLPLPWLTRVLGRRRAWLLLTQLSIISAIALMAAIDPAAGARNLTWMALAAVWLGFSSATQDIVIDAYRIESASEELQALMSSTYIAGYRIGMLVAGAGALFLASSFGSDVGAYSYSAWRNAYLVMAAMMLVGVVTTLLIPEPATRRAELASRSAVEYAGFLLVFSIGVAVFIGTFMASGLLLSAGSGGALYGFMQGALRLALALSVALFAAHMLVRAGVVRREMIADTYVEPVRDFFRRYGVKTSAVLLLLIGVYRISDIVLGVIANVFYQDLGFTKVEIASVVKTFGLLMTIAGGFLGGLIALRYGVMRTLLLGAVLAAVTNLLFLLLSFAGHDLAMLYLVISADNLSGGLASAAFVAFLSSLTNIQFTAMQYAIFSSLMTLLPKLLGGYSGTMVDGFGYPGFFVFTALLGIPVLLLVWRAGALLSAREALQREAAIQG